MGGLYNHWLCLLSSFLPYCTDPALPGCLLQTSRKRKGFHMLICKSKQPVSARSNQWLSNAQKQGQRQSKPAFPQMLGDCVLIIHPESQCPRASMQQRTASTEIPQFVQRKRQRVRNSKSWTPLYQQRALTLDKFFILSLYRMKTLDKTKLLIQWSSKTP